MKTINYYDLHAQEFYDRTIGADMSDMYDAFLSHIPEGGSILDAGCGSGRDSFAFLQHGFHVSAFDASQEMVRLASELTGLHVKQMLFQNLSSTNEFDGIWANASLLHVPFGEQRQILQRIQESLKPNGIFYASYKYGQGEMPTPEREFYLMNELTILSYLDGLFEPIKIWKTDDTRSERSPSPDKAWLNCLCRKIS